MKKPNIQLVVNDVQLDRRPAAAPGAKELPRDRKLAKMNDEYFVIKDEGTKCVVAFVRIRAFAPNQPARRELVTQSFADFRKRFLNDRVEVGENDHGQPIYKNTGDWWLRHPRRRESERAELVPGGEVPDDIFNLWQGFGVTAKKGPWPRLGRHLFEVLAARDRAAFLYILRWCAWCVQNPGWPAEVALVFRGGRGTGKSTFGRLLVDVFGQHGLQVSSSGHLTGRFNNHLRDCVLPFGDEAITPGDRDAESRLKAMLTELELPLEAKGKDLVRVRNNLHVVLASNHEWVVPAGADERRFAVFDVSECHKKDLSWFKRLNQALDAGERAAFLEAMLRLPLGDWHPRQDVPQNAALTDQKIRSLPLLEQRVLDYLVHGDLPKGAAAPLGGGRVLLCTDPFIKSLKMKERRPGLRRQLEQILGRRLGFEKARKMIRGRRHHGWVLPPLPEARRRFDEAYGLSLQWDGTREWAIAGA